MMTTSGTPGLSVCMIVRDEEKLLPGCLSSLHGLADELVVVDTGSTDGTLAILDAFGAKVHRHQWENDFSKHRNQCVQYATGEWILQIDADERLWEGGIHEVRRTIDNAPGDISHYLVEIHDCDRRGRRRNFFLYPRLFKNRAGACYHGEVHNQLRIAGGRARSRIGVDHLGYHLEPGILARKFGRTRTLLMKQLERDHNDTFALLNLTLVHAMQKDVDGVIRYGEVLATLLQDQSVVKPVYYSLYHPLAAAHLSLGNYARAESLAAAVLRRVQHLPDGHHLLAWTALLQKNYEKLLTHGAAYEKSVEAWKARPLHLDDPECHSLARLGEVRCWLGMALMQCGRLSSGLAALEKGFKDPAFDEHMALHLIRLIGELRPEMLMEWAPRCLQLFSDDVDFVFAVLSILQQASGITLMRYCLSVLDARHLPEQGDLYRRALLHVLREEFTRAAELLKAIGEREPQYVDAQRQLRYCHERLHLREQITKSIP